MRELRKEELSEVSGGFLFGLLGGWCRPVVCKPAPVCAPKPVPEVPCKPVVEEVPCKPAPVCAPKPVACNWGWGWRRRC